MGELQGTDQEHVFDLIDHHSLSLEQLYPNSDRRDAFLSRLQQFTQSDENLSKIVSVADGELAYLSESFVPQRPDPGKHNLAFVLGNPAPESIALQAMYAYEAGGKRYHRFWNVLQRTGILQFDVDAATLDPHEKMARLFGGQYSSPFNVYILPFYSLASPPSGLWNGVAGLQRLFAEAFPLVEQYDAAKVLTVLNERFQDGDTVLTFQKDAYAALQQHAEHARPYDYKQLFTEPLISDLRIPNGALLTVGCLLPTRLMYSGQTGKTLSELAREGNIAL